MMKSDEGEVRETVHRIIDANRVYREHENFVMGVIARAISRIRGGKVLNTAELATRRRHASFEELVKRSDWKTLSRRTGIPKKSLKGISGSPEEVVREITLIMGRRR